MNLSNNLLLRSDSRTRGFFAGTLLAATLLLGHSAQALDGTWNVNTNGNWNLSDTSPWLGGIVADGALSTAFFTNDISTSTRVVTLTEPRTIGNVTFGDADPSTAASWTLAGSATNKLILAGTHTITVNALGTNSLASITTVIDGTVGLIKDGTGILSLSGVNTYTGGTTISAGTLRAGSSSALGDTTGAVTVASGASLQLQNNLTIGNAINLNGSSALSLVSSSQSILSGTVTLQSASTIALGTTSPASLEISGGLNLGANTLTVSGTRPLTLSGAISGSGIISMSTTGGTTNITNNNATYSGQVQVNRSNLGVGNDGAFGTGSIRLGVSDATSGIRSTDTTTRNISNAITFTGTASGANSIILFGSSSALLNGDLNFTNAANTVLGGVRKFDVRNRTEFTGGFTGSGAGITMQSTSTGTLVLAGDSTYTGTTTVNAGTLLVNGSLTSATTVTAGTLGGSGSTTGAVVIGNNAGGSDSFITPGNSPGTFTTTSSLTLNSDATYQFELNSDALTADKIVANGVTLDSSSQFSFADLGSSAIALSTIFVAIDNTSGSAITGTFLGLAEGATFSSGLNQFQASYVGGTGNDFTLTVVPEPSTFAMLLGGFGMLLGFQRSRRRK